MGAPFKHTTLDEELGRVELRDDRPDVVTCCFCGQQLSRYGVCFGGWELLIHLHALSSRRS